MNIENTGFTGEGFDSFPNVYEDNKNVGTVSGLTIEALYHRTEAYSAFLNREDIMPRARNAANRIMDHLLFELAYRDGVYESGE